MPMCRFRHVHRYSPVHSHTVAALCLFHPRELTEKRAISHLGFTYLPLMDTIFPRNASHTLYYDEKR
jgi:hypothetical protein